MIFETHKIETTLGTFQFSWHPSDKKKDWWIAGRFLNPERAKNVYDCNQFSGKYNFHGFETYTPLNALIDFLNDLKIFNRLV